MSLYGTFGLSLLCASVGILLPAVCSWIRVSRRRSVAESMPPAVEEAPLAVEMKPTIDRMEGHVRNYAREVEERIQDRLDELDRLIEAADSEITRLERLLPGAERKSHSVTSLAPAQENIGEHRAKILRPDFDLLIRQLSDAGLTPEQIGRRVGKTGSDIRNRLGRPDNQDFGDLSNAA